MAEGGLFRMKADGFYNRSCIKLSVIRSPRISGEVTLQDRRKRRHLNSYLLSSWCRKICSLLYGPITNQSHTGRGGRIHSASFVIIK